MLKIRKCPKCGHLNPTDEPSCKNCSTILIYPASVYLAENKGKKNKKLAG